MAIEADPRKNLLEISRAQGRMAILEVSVIKNLSNLYAAWTET